MEWSPQQDAALMAARRWFLAAQRARRAGQAFQQVWYLAGYAGTGKTTLALKFAEEAEAVCFGAFTGKAALVMRSKGCAGAATIHSLIYSVQIDEHGVRTFSLNPESYVADCDLVVIDECSMVGKELGEDLLSFGVPVLVLGDPAQLPPVQSAGFFTERDPDVMLTEVHRQAADNPIIRLSMRVREGYRLPVGIYGSSKVIPARAVDRAEVLAADQLLVGRNRTRHLYNARLRALKSFDGPTPQVGERLVCLRNKTRKGLLNGGLWSVLEVMKRRKGGYLLPFKLKPEDAGLVAQAVDVVIHPAFFEGRESELDWKVRRNSDEFDFGYTLTTHKAQGSQWDRVYLFDESDAFGEDASRWLYTAITRAAEAVTIVRMDA